MPMQLKKSGGQSAGSIHGRTRYKKVIDMVSLSPAPGQCTSHRALGSSRSTSACAMVRTDAPIFSFSTSITVMGTLLGCGVAKMGISTSSSTQDVVVANRAKPVVLNVELPVRSWNIT
mmetsp:Transcript_51647/g.110337  ORF Transcript_51647/g.110337 Transcript_51647/m.110337 type:complete len:118 (-) Transcript_51647:584-937(-)